ncbi:type II and III secretion system protein family protein [Ferrimonas aestuarii]|uniref:Pilus assembly protein CpaC n=1 Tax=Ferrimonas aestuarii TaxID=2569539 RepID=A0A4U1BTH3_9GAMM|nr:pilus assembly protein N-terminal domain-containing protein [Ferrimonas aestuarii]TKB58479.1 pilus assembly protein CpaC [Ferrimonas aestuarii]
MRAFIFMGLCLLLLSVPASAETERLSVNDAVNLSFEQSIGTVFISQPNVADYKVINDRQLVLFGLAAGQTRLMIYDKQGQLLQQRLIHVELPLTHITKQIELRYPKLTIHLDAVAEQVAVRGTVFTEAQRDEIYALVAGLLGREKELRYQQSESYEFENGMIESEDNAFFRKYTYPGIIEGLELFSPQQINVRVSVAQVSDEFGETLGVDWSSIGDAAGSFRFDDLKAPDFSALVTALGDDSIAEVLAEPNLTVMSGESASFLVGGEVPIIVTNNNTTNISFKEFGIGLDLTAKVHSPNKIRLQIAPEVSAISGYVSSAGIEVPQLSSRRAMTTVELADGDSFMLGGLMSSEEVENLKRVPLLGDIPYFGALFRNAKTSRVKTELVIVATVNLVQPTKASNIVLPHIDRSNTLDRWLNTVTENPNDTQSQALALDLLQRGGFIQ